MCSEPQWSMPLVKPDDHISPNTIVASETLAPPPGFLFGVGIAIYEIQVCPARRALIACHLIIF
jgi:hypothetical protein